MENNQNNQHEFNNQMSAEVHNLTTNQNRSAVDLTINIDKQSSEYNIGNYADDQLTYEQEEQNKKANRDILWGAIWCVGGLIGTFANIGYVFWGAIIFGGIQFFKGLMNRV